MHRLLALVFIQCCLSIHCLAQCYDSYELYDQAALDSFIDDYGDCDTVRRILIRPRDGAITNMIGLSHIKYVEGLSIYLNAESRAIGDLVGLEVNGAVGLWDTNPDTLAFFPNLREPRSIGLHSKANFHAFRHVEHIEYVLSMSDEATYEGWLGYTSGDTVRTTFTDMAHALDISPSMEWADGKHMNWFNIDGADTIYDTGTYSIPSSNLITIRDVRYFDGRALAGALQQADRIGIVLVDDMDYGDGFVHIDTLHDRLIVGLNRFDIDMRELFPAVTYLTRLSVTQNEGRLTLFDHPIELSPTIIYTWDGDLVPKVSVSDNPLLTDCTSEFWCDLVRTWPDSLLVIENNGPGCSYDEIVAACGVMTSVTTTTTTDIHVWPSPARDRLYVRGVAAGTGYTLVTMQGQVAQQAVTSDAGIDVAELPTGMYVLRLIAEDGVYSEVVVIE